MSLARERDLFCAAIWRMTRSVVLYEADRSLGQQVAQPLLAGFTGTRHSDFYAVYWTLPGVTHAACWGHLCRTARQVAERASAAQGADGVPQPAVGPVRPGRGRAGSPGDGGAQRAAFHLNHVQLGKWCFRNETQAGQGRAAKLY